MLNLMFEIRPANDSNSRKAVQPDPLPKTPLTLWCGAEYAQTSSPEEKSLFASFSPEKEVLDLASLALSLP
jgi:hypothetical protein